MTFIAEGGGRTVTNCTVYDRRKVYEIVIRAHLPEVQSVYGTGEVERTGNIVVQEIAYHIIATDEGLAKAMFAKQHSHTKYTLITVRALFCIDGEIVTGRD